MQQALEFSQFQLGRIKRFAFGVNALMDQDSKNVRLDPRKAMRVLELALDPAELPEEKIPDLSSVLNRWIQFFMVLQVCNSREKRAQRLFFVLLSAALLLGAYYWYTDGILRGVVALVLGLLSVFVINLFVSSRYVWRGFSPLAWGLTHTEVRFALDAVINDRNWQARG